MVSRRALTLLLAGALVLPIVVSVLVGVGRMLEKMSDPAGGLFVERLALAGGILWGIDLIVLVVFLGLNALGGDEPPDSAAGE